MTLALEAAGLEDTGRQRLKHVDLAVMPGRVHVLLGPNGAGKSTALGLLAGDRPPDRGRAHLDGRALSAWPSWELARRRAVLAQAPPAAFAFRVAELVALGRLPWRASPGAPDEQAVVRRCLARVDAEALADRPCAQLSGGEQARVQFARALAQIDAADSASRVPRYLLLDEPGAHLDLAHQHRLLSVLRDLATAGVGVLAVMHDPNLALRHADEVTLLAAGRSIASGAPAEVLTAERLSAVYGLPMARHVLPDGSPHLQVG